MPNILENDQVYVSLVGPFLGYYARIPGAKSDMEARILCNATKGMKHIWMTTYTKEEVAEMIVMFGGAILNLKQSAFKGWDDVYRFRKANDGTTG